MGVAPSTPERKRQHESDDADSGSRKRSRDQGTPAAEVQPALATPRSARQLAALPSTGRNKRRSLMPTSTAAPQPKAAAAGAESSLAAVLDSVQAVACSEAEAAVAPSAAVRDLAREIFETWRRELQDDGTIAQLTDTSALPPHPRNQEMLADMARYHTTLARLDAELGFWDTALEEEAASGPPQPESANHTPEDAVLPEVQLAERARDQTLVEVQQLLHFGQLAQRAQQQLAQFLADTDSSTAAPT